MTTTTPSYTVTRHGDVVVISDADEGRRLRDELTVNREVANKAKKAADASAKLINGLLGDALVLATSTGEPLATIKLVEKSPAVDWERLEADLRLIGRTKAHYLVEQPKTRQLHPAPATVVVTPTLPTQPSAANAAEATPKKSKKK